MEQFLQFLHAKTATSSTEQYKKKVSYSEKMRWGRGWPKQLYVLFIGKPEILLKGTSGKILLFNIGNFIAKFKNVFCLLRTILENASPNN